MTLPIVLLIIMAIFAIIGFGYKVSKDEKRRLLDDMFSEGEITADVYTDRISKL